MGTTGFLQRELDRIAVALRADPRPECYDRLHAAQQALAWASDPTAFASPCEVMNVAQGNPAVLAGCLDGGHPQSS